MIPHLWIQYGYDDPEDAPILQTAESEEDARKENTSIQDGGPWYCYDASKQELKELSGPHYFP